jgi:LmbE family N-acetylglucosaminyl deacetylase
LVGRTKVIDVSISFYFKITLHASELKKFFAHSNLEGFRREEMKKCCQILGTKVPELLPRGAKCLA